MAGVMTADAGRIEAALKPARLWMAVYAVDYRDARAGREREVAERVQRRLRLHKFALLGVAAFFALIVLGSFAFQAWMWVEGARTAYLPITSTLIQGGAPIVFGYALVRSHRSAIEALQRLVDGADAPHAGAARSGQASSGS